MPSTRSAAPPAWYPHSLPRGMLDRVCARRTPVQSRRAARWLQPARCDQAGRDLDRDVSALRHPQVVASQVEQPVTSAVGGETDMFHINEPDRDLVDERAARGDFPHQPGGVADGITAAA